jgi:predicted RNase H-like HicB family nuclease/predicted RNA binding protein YcfA (HicA-like mRNA interferase family)
MAGQVVRLTAAVSREDDWYVARALEVEVASQGRTIEEALANLREALELYFEDEPVPDTTEPIVAPHRGRALRMSPRRLPVASGAQVVRALEKDGFEVISTKGSHRKLRARPQYRHCPAAQRVGHWHAGLHPPCGRADA